MMLNSRQGYYLDLSEVIGPGSMNGLAAFTVEAEINASSISHDATIISSVGRKGAAQLTMSAFSLGMMAGGVLHSSVTLAIRMLTLTSKQPITANSIHHVALSYDSLNSTLLS